LLCQLGFFSQVKENVTLAKYQKERTDAKIFSRDGTLVNKIQRYQELACDDGCRTKSLLSVIPED
jgi:hypothetical protein